MQGLLWTFLVGGIILAARSQEFSSRISWSSNGVSQFMLLENLVVFCFNESILACTNTTLQMLALGRPSRPYTCLLGSNNTSMSLLSLKISPLALASVSWRHRAYACCTPPRRAPSPIAPCRAVPFPHSSAPHLPRADGAGQLLREAAALEKPCQQGARLGSEQVRENHRRSDGPTSYSGGVRWADVSLTRACWLPQFPPGRLCLTVTPCFKCFRRFRLMFQVFDLKIAKVYLRCCMCCIDYIHMLQAYVFSVSGVSDVCFKCFICMLQK
jgi:hypothetical protein